MIEKIKAAPLSVKIAMGILGLCLLALVYIAPVMVITGGAIIWSINTVINYFIDKMDL